MDERPDRRLECFNARMRGDLPIGRRKQPDASVPNRRYRSWYLIQKFTALRTTDDRRLCPETPLSAQSLRSLDGVNHAIPPVDLHPHMGRSTLKREG